MMSCFRQKFTILLLFLGSYILHYTDVNAKIYSAYQIGAGIGLTTGYYDNEVFQNHVLWHPEDSFYDDIINKKVAGHVECRYVYFIDYHLGFNAIVNISHYKNIIFPRYMIGISWNIIQDALTITESFELKQKRILLNFNIGLTGGFRSFSLLKNCMGNIVPPIIMNPEIQFTFTNRFAISSGTYINYGIDDKKIIDYTLTPYLSISYEFLPSIGKHNHMYITEYGTYMENVKKMSIMPKPIKPKKNKNEKTDHQNKDNLNQQPKYYY